MIEIKNFAQWIFEQNKKRAEKLAIVNGNVSVTYSELECRSRKFATTLKQYNLRPGDRIIIDMDDCVEWPMAFFACVLLGLNPVLTSPNLPVKDLTKIIDKSSALAIITDGDSRMQLSIITIPKALIQLPADIYTDSYAYHPDESCLWLLSSGTTGESKCIVHRHASFFHLYNQNAQHAFLIDNNSQVLCTGKLSWTYGFNTNITYTLGAGGTAHLISGVPAPSKIYKICQSNQITHLVSVPAVYAAMLRYPGLLSNDLKHVITAAEVTPVAIREQFLDIYGHQFIDVIGQSETMNVFAAQYLPVKHLPGRRFNLPGVEMQIRDNSGNLVPNGTMGEVYVKTPCVAIGYHKDWSKSKQTFIGAWVKTGDMMTVDGQDIYEYQGRNDDLFRVNGHWISNVEIEIEILNDIDVQDCAVVALPNQLGLPEIHAYIISNNPKQDIKQRLQKTLAKHKVPRHIHWVSELPKTVTNKIKRSALRTATV